ncbi:Syntaxin-binding protein 5-like protein [Myotis davidii]|uniref:Syntaxin-binding protein 5-like protein n=1 Tax=Myotis davidii TaxID=225400 RepID=L5MCV1_MYODS|nr:Syntaxin-binding protein 5-like protein [Myotis davidii]
MKKFNFRKVLDGFTASSPGSGSSGSSNSGGGAGSGAPHSGGPAGLLREEIQESLTSEYFQICKEPSGDVLSAAVEAGEAPTTAAVLTSCEPGFWLSSAPPVGAH